ncbi:MAG: valine--tRNA ligase [Nanoarchaeota archaeon]
MGSPLIKETRWSKELEKPIYEHWKKNNIYKFNKNSKKKVYSIDTPPPYVNTPIHIGQATTYVLMDMFARFKRMTNHEVIFPLGLDRNGLPIEMAAEKKFNIKLTDLKREEAIEKCKQILEESSLASVDSFLKLGICFNSWKKGKGIGDLYETDSPDYRALTQDTFIDMYKNNLIYEDERINNYCPGCQTTIADAEVTYEDLPTFFNFIKFKVKETGEEIVIGTTRPELICTCGMIIFNPKDSRYKHLQGKTAITPLYNKEIPIKTHPLAEIDKGTGLVMMCSAGDLSDIRFFREMNLKPIIAINKNGTMNEHSGFLNELKVKDAREKIINLLKEKNLIVKQEKVTHRTPICERSNDPIEFISMKEFYVKQLEYKKIIKKLADKINFYSPQSKQILLDWIDSISIDWPISRRRFYATEIPLWYCKNCNYIVIPPKGRYYQPWKEDPPIKKCPKCKHNKFYGEMRVFDTWFDSSISPLYILKYERDKKFFEKNSPCTLRPQGKEITRTWLYYTLLKCYLLIKKPIFKDVWINYHIVDEKGYKMSKSKGNSIDPKEVLNRFGAEPFRLWAAIEGNLEKTDFRCSFERIEGASKTITKLLNVARFVSLFEKPKKPKQLVETDKWITYELNNIIKLANERYESYDFHNPAANIKHFLWETFASHYIELVKTRAYNQNNKFSKAEQDSAIFTLYSCLETILKLLAPIIPLITYHIYKDLNEKDIHFEQFPNQEKILKPEFSTEELMNLNSEIWKNKKDKGLSLKENIKRLTIPKTFKSIEKDIIETHHILELNFSDKFSISL